MFGLPTLCINSLTLINTQISIKDNDIEIWNTYIHREYVHHDLYFIVWLYVHEHWTMKVPKRERYQELLVNCQKEKVLYIIWVCIIQCTYFESFMCKLRLRFIYNTLMEFKQSLYRFSCLYMPTQVISVINWTVCVVLLCTQENISFVYLCTYRLSKFYAIFRPSSHLLFSLFQLFFH